MLLHFARKLVAPLGLLGGAATAFVACGGISVGDGSSGSSGSSSGSSGSSSGSSGCSNNPAGGACPPTTPPNPPPRAPKIHRAEATACVVTKPAENPYIPEGGLGPPTSCRSNADCTDGRNGRCDGNGHDGYRCTYDACYSDSECAGGVCACNGASRATNNVCLVGGCQIDSNCGAGGFCSPTLGSCGHYGKAVAYYCHTAEDECIDDEDCGEGGMFGQPGYCAYEKTVGRWKCSTAECVG